MTNLIYLDYDGIPFYAMRKELILLMQEDERIHGMVWRFTGPEHYHVTLFTTTTSHQERMEIARKTSCDPDYLARCARDGFFHRRTSPRVGARKRPRPKYGGDIHERDSKNTG